MEMTREALMARLAYDQETGIFTWLVGNGRNVDPGDIAGYPSGNGHIQIKIDGTAYKAHRLAWLYVYGEFPPGDLDHRDTDKTNNRILNLRPATPSQNRANCGLRADNKSGLKGVYWRKDLSRWQAQIRKNGVCQHLGYFDTPEAAHAAYCEAAIRLHGEFARVA